MIYSTKFSSYEFRDINTLSLKKRKSTLAVNETALVLEIDIQVEIQK